MFDTRLHALMNPAQWPTQHTTQSSIHDKDQGFLCPNSCLQVLQVVRCEHP